MRKRASWAPEEHDLGPQMRQREEVAPGVEARDYRPGPLMRRMLSWRVDDGG